MKIYGIGDFAHIVHRTVRTVQKWDSAGKLKAHRTMTNQRYYTQAQLDQVLGITPKPSATHKIYIYARVSNYNQKKALRHQIKFLKQYATSRGYQIERPVFDIGSGLDYKRRNWNKLIKLALEHKQIKVIVAYPDRFVRIGFNWFTDLFNQYGSTIEVVNRHKSGTAQELISDLSHIIKIFSNKLPTLHKYTTLLKKDKDLK